MDAFFCPQYTWVTQQERLYRSCFQYKIHSWILNWIEIVLRVTVKQFATLNCFEIVEFKVILKYKKNHMKELSKRVEETTDHFHVSVWLKFQAEY